VASFQLKNKKQNHKPKQKTTQTKQTKKPQKNKPKNQHLLLKGLENKKNTERNKKNGERT